MEWILGILIIILGAVAVFVIYLSERVTVFETLLGSIPKSPEKNWLSMSISALILLVNSLAKISGMRCAVRN